MTIDQSTDETTEPAEVVDAAEPADASPPAASQDPKVRSTWKRVAPLAIAAMLAISGIAAWQGAARDDAIAAADTRDAVLITAKQQITTLNTLDYRNIDAGLKAWSAATTGTLHDQLAQVDAENRALLADQKKISTGKVIDAAVLEVDGDTASVIAAVEVTVVDGAKPDAASTVKRNRFSADLVKVKGAWKLENLQQVAVNL